MLLIYRASVFILSGADMCFATKLYEICSAEQLSHIKNDYQQVCGKIKNLGDIEEDDLPTAQMLSAFRKLLNKFNYSKYVC